MKYHNQLIYQSYMFTFIKIIPKMTPGERAERCNRKNMIVSKLINWKFFTLHFRHFTRVGTLIVATLL